MKMKFISILLLLSFTSAILAESDSAYSPILENSFESIAVYDNVTLIGYGYQINAQFVAVASDLVERYDNYYDHLYTLSQNGNLSNVLYIWKSPRLLDSTDFSLLVLDDMDQLEQYSELFWKAMEVVNEDGEDDDSEDGVDLNGDGLVDILETLLVNASRVLKRLVNIFFMQNILQNLNATENAFAHK